MTIIDYDDDDQHVKILDTKPVPILISSGSTTNIDENDKKIKSTRKGIFNQVLLTCAVLILAAGCGMPIGYSAVLLPQLYNATDTDPMRMDVSMGSWFASIHSLATPVGSFVSGPIMDRIGRRPALLFSIIPLLAGWIFLATANSHVLLVIGRLFAGVAVGLVAAPSQILIAECADPALRGFLIGAPFVSYALGILFVYMLGATLHWRLVAWCALILPSISIVSLFFAPESPAWLVRNGHTDRARQALRLLRGSDRAARLELEELETRFSDEKLTINSKENIFHAVVKTAVLKPLILINGFSILMIFSGTYLIVFYAVDIISEFGQEINSMSAAVITAVIRLIFTFAFCVSLFYIRRRPMIIFAGLGSGLSTTTLGIYMLCRSNSQRTPLDFYVAVVCIMLYIATNTGFMIIPGIMIGELLPSRIRGRIAGYIFTFFNIAFFGVAKMFPWLHQTFRGSGIFLLFGASSFGATIVMWLMLPETMGQSLGQIEDYFQQKNWLWSTRDRKGSDGNSVTAVKV